MHSPHEQQRERRSWPRRHKVLSGFISLGALIVVVIIASGAAKKGGGVSTASSGTTGTTAAKGSAPATHAAASAGIGSYFDVKDSSGDAYRVTLNKIIDPARGTDQFSQPQSGDRFVGAVFTIQATGSSPQNEDANNDAAMIGSNGQTYNSTIASIDGYTDFSDGVIKVAQGQSSVGAVTFQVPDGVKIAGVQWSAAGGFGSAVQWHVG